MRAREEENSKLKFKDFIKPVSSTVKIPALLSSHLQASNSPKNSIFAANGALPKYIGNSDLPLSSLALKKEYIFSSFGITKTLKPTNPLYPAKISSGTCVWVFGFFSSLIVWAFI